MLGRGGGLKGDSPNKLATPNIVRGMVGVGWGRALLLKSLLERTGNKEALTEADTGENNESGVTVVD